MDPHFKPCRLCGEQTAVVVNIRFRATAVCDFCCLAITKQTVASLTVERLRSEDGSVTTEIRSQESDE